MNPDLLKDIFPLSNKAGNKISHIDTKLMQDMAKKFNALTPSEINTILQEHQLFLENGGANGKWQTILVSSLVMGVYYGAKTTVGKQADFYQKKIIAIDFSKINLTAANFIGSYAEKIIARHTNFHKAIFTDAWWVGTDFEGSDLTETDFSRGNFSNCNFKNCNLQFADFENCNLTGADFTGANLGDSRFPGAILKDVKYLSNLPYTENDNDGGVHK